MIKIVHIAKPIGGVGVYIHLLSKHMCKTKFTNSIICNTEDNIIEIKDGADNLIKHYHVNLKREISVINDIQCLKKIIKLLKEIKPDIIHCHSAKAGVLGRIAGNYLNIATLYTPHAYSYLSTEKKIKQILFKQIEKHFKRYNSKTLACSESEYQRTLNDLKFPTTKTLLWNNSIAKTSIEESIKKSNFPEKFICAVGRPSYQKNTILLIKSIHEVKKQIQNIHLMILGVGLYSPLLREVEELIKNLNLENNITLIPWLKREESLAIVKKSLFFISTSKYEGLAYAVIEALALSKPCILTNVDGNKDLIKENINGFLVPENKLIIAEKIINLYSNKELLNRLSIGSFEVFKEKFDIEKNITKLEQLYTDLI